MRYSKLNARHNRLNKNLSKRQRLAKVRYLRIKINELKKQRTNSGVRLVIAGLENIINELKKR